MKGELTWIELSKSKFKKNIATMRSIMDDGVLLAPCVKANAYGHGLLECAKIFVQSGADWLCVDSVDEAILLRNHGIRTKMLIMGYVGPKDLHKVVQHNVRVFLYDYWDARILSREAVKQKKKVFVHIKIDTGMNRQGVQLSDLYNFLNKVKKMPNLRIEGIATHFATADELALTKRQFYFNQREKFQKAILVAKNILENHFIVHCANSGAILTDPSSQYNLVRPGIAMYGYYPSDDVKKISNKNGLFLEPVLSLHTRIAQIKILDKKECVSYGCTFKAKKKMTIAVLPIGYYDGIRRDLSNRGQVLIHGMRAKILGRVCMNIMMVDITRIRNAKVGDTVTIIGRQGREKIDADDIAKILDTVNYEIVAQLRESIKKYIVR